LKKHSQNSEEAERLQVYESWPEISPKIRRAILLMVAATTDDSAPSNGEPSEETLSQGGGVLTSLSGGDERSEPESLNKFPHGVLPSVTNLTPTAENNEK
jgi:hypothetical protein